LGSWFLAAGLLFREICCWDECNFFLNSVPAENVTCQCNEAESAAIMQGALVLLMPLAGNDAIAAHSDRRVQTFSSKARISVETSSIYCAQLLEDGDRHQSPKRRVLNKRQDDG
jgi:hypothetical protein